MARKLKIKRYRDGGGFYKARPHPVAVILTLVVIGALVFLGVSIYGPVANFLRELTTPTEPELDLPPPPTAPPITAPTEPPTEPEPVYPAMRAIYLPASVLADDERLGAVLESVRGSEINTVLVEIKDSTGNVLFNTENASAMEWGAVVEAPLDLAAFAKRLEEEGLELAVRLHAFQDSVAAFANRENAIQYQNDGWLWLDGVSVEEGGRPWLNPYSEGARQYIASLCLEAADAGANFVLLDSFQCPTGSVTNANFGSRAGVVSRAEILNRFEEDLAERLEEKGARSALYLPATTLLEEAENETRYGGSPLSVVGKTVVPGALPWQFPAGFSYNGTTLDDPVARPDTATDFTLSLFLDENPFSGDPPDYIPLLQGGSEPEQNAAVYTSAEVEAQIDAARARGAEEYILYVSDGNYELSGETED